MVKKQRNKIVPEAHLFLIKQGKILLLRRGDVPYESGKWHLPAGRIEDQEFPIESIIREAKEEVGIIINAKNLKIVHIMYRKEKEQSDRIAVFVKCDRFIGEPKICEPNKHDKIGWYSISKLPKPMMPYVVKAIKYIQKGILYSESDI